MIDLVNITYRYPQGAAYVIRDFNASFTRGEITAVSGKNGCGKTTLSKLIVGILRPSSGNVMIDGENIGKMDLFEIGRRVGYVFQNPGRQLFCDTVYNEIAFGLRNMKAETTALERKATFTPANSKKAATETEHKVALKPRTMQKETTEIGQKVDYYLELFDLARYRATYPGKLSIGEKQRLALAAVLALGTSFLVLDEPTTGLDARQQLELGGVLTMLRQEHNCGVVLFSHDDNFIARYSDRILVMP